MEENRRSSRVTNRRNYAQMDETGIPSQSGHEIDSDSRGPSRRNRSERNTPATISVRAQRKRHRRQEQREEQREDEDEQREQQAEREEEHLYALYGITVDENNEPSIDKEKFKTVLEHIESRYNGIIV